MSCLVLQAIEFVQMQRDDDLWETLIGLALESPALTGTSLCFGCSLVTVVCTHVIVDSFPSRAASCGFDSLFNIIITFATTTVMVIIVGMMSTFRTIATLVIPVGFIDAGWGAGELMDNIGGYVTPLRLLQRIPLSMSLDGLRDRLVHINSDQIAIVALQGS